MAEARRDGHVATPRKRWDATHPREREQAIDSYKIDRLDQLILHATTQSKEEG